MIYALQREAVEVLIPAVVDHYSPQDLSEILTSSLSREKLAEVVSTDEIISAIPPEQMLNALTPEQKLSSLTPEQMLNALMSEQTLGALTAEQLDALRKKLLETTPSPAQSGDKPKSAE
jgi:hypothetical protein